MVDPFAIAGLFVACLVVGISAVELAIMGLESLARWFDG